MNNFKCNRGYLSWAETSQWHLILVTYGKVNTNLDHWSCADWGPESGCLRKPTRTGNMAWWPCRAPITDCWVWSLPIDPADARGEGQGEWMLLAAARTDDPSEGSGWLSQLSGALPAPTVPRFWGCGWAERSRGWGVGYRLFCTPGIHVHPIAKDSQRKKEKGQAGWHQGTVEQEAEQKTEGFVQ